MNFAKSPRQARKMAKEQKHLQRVARTNPNALQGKDRAKCLWTIELENYDEPVKASRRHAEEEDEYAEYA